MRILGIAGSLRRGSHNRKLLRAASMLLPPEVELVEWDGLAGLPAFDEDLEETPPPTVLELFEAIRDYFAPFRARRDELSANPDEVDAILHDGAERARAAASDTYARVKRAVGLA